MHKFSVLLHVPWFIMSRRTESVTSFCISNPVELKTVKQERTALVRAPADAPMQFLSQSFLLTSFCSLYSFLFC